MADDSHITSQGASVKGGALLDRWADYDWRNGTHIGDLLPLDRLTIRTVNSTYELVVVTPDNAEVAVRGGPFFPSFVRVYLAGSSLGGSFLKMRSIHVGFRLEISAAVGVILTSPVRSVSVAAASASGDALM